MRWAFALLLLAATAAAQDPFAPLPERFRPGFAVPGAEARVNEELARLKQALAQKPVDVITLRRAYPLMVRLGRGGALRPLLDSAIKAFDTPELRAMRGAILSSNPGLAQIVFPKGMNRKDMERLLELLKGTGRTGLKGARADLEIAVKARPGDWSSRNTLASVLARLDKKGHNERIERLRNEAAAIRLRDHDVPVPIDLTEGAARLRERAEQLEQQKTPKHDAALALRKRALVLDFCSHGIPFGSHADVWTSVALLAPGYMVRENLTRTFVTRKSDISSVDVHYYEPTLERRLTSSSHF
ncbi:MAG: hypothetical protein O7E54_04590 [Planctomycetota bacterium]|nr:hypothetical protein [Planctomycetota bacterium]